ncbi:MAG: glycosyltransferase family 2 protein, partial [Clostridia bacterium]
MAKKEPKISVIIPCYNQEKYIKECLNSILNQSFKDFEIIAVDDGSTDNTLNILKSYERIHSNIIVLTQRNKSAGAARNYGLSRAQGKYLLFMDSDDFLDHEAFAILDNITNTEKADIYFYNFRTFDDQTKEVCDKIMFDNLDKISVYNNGKIRYGLTTFEQKKEFFIWSYVAPWNKLYNREFVVKNNLKFDEIFSTNDRTFYFSS